MTYEDCKKENSPKSPQTLLGYSKAIRVNKLAFNSGAIPEKILQKEVILTEKEHKRVRNQGQKRKEIIKNLEIILEIVERIKEDKQNVPNPQ